ncbi:MAG: 6-phospho-3-hexuloisomerase [Parcubacteria group bacterium CG_4_9_14_0_2_um_filter_35_11]|nr:MAG: 6-phospho-3-hexuloisomerase [Parcubacteria group bacterium CG07_land_8_20_14_0_80_35_11]PJC47665.1 MAG: 6-phospho-3-hexuloisomerase [Parcubacteria group bacterium CG_4_9_14_0_2_um_filter_35_11]
MSKKIDEIEVDKNIGDRVLSSMEQIADLVKKSVARVREEKIQEKIRMMVQMIINIYGTEHRIFTVGEGRSGFVAKAFAMRLMHVGFNAFVIGETTTPGVEPGDIVIAISGSGTTQPVITVCQIIIGEEVKAKLIAITSKKESTLARIADLVIDLPGRKGIISASDYIERILTRSFPQVPLGTVFETNAMTFCDSVVGELMNLTKTTEEKMQSQHAKNQKPDENP